MRINLNSKEYQAEKPKTANGVGKFKNIKMKKLILGFILAFCVLSCSQDGVPGKDGINGTNGTNGNNASTTSLGKTHIFITGNITNAQAAAQIAQEVGTNTTHISIAYSTGLTSIDLSVLTSVWEININNNYDLTTVNLNGLKSINSLTVNNENKLQSVSLNSLISSTYISVSSCPLITSLSLPQLKFGTLQLYGDLPLLSSLNTPLLSIGGVNISGTSLISVDLPLLNKVTGTFYVTGNKKLMSINIPNLTSVSSSLYIYFSENSFTSTEINKLLSIFNTKITFSAANQINIFLQGQTPKAPPTGQGIIDKNALIAKGFTVTTD